MLVSENHGALVKNATEAHDILTYLYEKLTINRRRTYQVKSVVVLLSEFAELNKVQRPNLWPYDYSFIRMGRHVAAQRLPNYQIKWLSCVKPYKLGHVSALLGPHQHALVRM